MPKIEAPTTVEQQVFSTLALCYYPPDTAVGDRIDLLERALAPVGGEFHDLAAKLVQQFNEAELQQLKVDQAKLFVGPFQLLAPPFGSVYLEDEGLLMGDSTMHLKDLYLEADLEMAEDFKNPPDHIAAELEFLGFLLQIEEQAEPTEKAMCQDLRRRFLDEHLGRWFQEFTEKVVQNAETDFYRTLGMLTRLFVQEQLDEIEALHVSSL